MHGGPRRGQHGGDPEKCVAPRTWTAVDQRQGHKRQNRAQIKNNARNHMRTIDTGSREKQSRREGAAATVRIRRNALHNMREQQQ